MDAAAKRAWNGAEERKSPMWPDLHPPSLDPLAGWAVLLTERQFEHALQRERQRCDRCGSDVALVRLELAPREDVLLPILRRVRSTDELGWIGPGVLGILLPETNGEGASKLVGDLLESDPTGLLRSSRCGIYAYPEALPEDMRPVRGGRRAGVPRRAPGEPTHAG